MEKKKSNRTNLEKMRTVFFQSGLILALVLMILAFEWKTPIGNLKDLGTTSFINDDFDFVPPTRPDKPKPPEIIKKRDDFEIKKDDEKLKEEFEAKSSESDENTVVEIDSTLFNIGGDEEIDEPIPFFKVEVKPQFMDGDDATLLNWIGKNTTYPRIALENRIQGAVWVSFTISKKGKVKDVAILRKVDPYLDKEAIRVIESMPDWTPGVQAGKKVSVPYQLPIKFVIQQ